MLFFIMLAGIVLIGVATIDDHINTFRQIQQDAEEEKY